MKATIWHNPRCSKSRKILAILHEAGAEVTVVDYIERPPTASDLSRLLGLAGLAPREGLRRAEDGAKILDDAAGDAILAAMELNPIIIERPLVETEKGVRLCRPPERVRDIL